MIPLFEDFIENSVYRPIESRAASDLNLGAVINRANLRCTKHLAQRVNGIDNPDRTRRKRICKIRQIVELERGGHNLLEHLPVNTMRDYCVIAHQHLFEYHFLDSWIERRGVQHGDGG